MRSCNQKYLLRIILLLLVIQFFSISCKNDEVVPPDNNEYLNEAENVITQLWTTSSLNYEIKRDYSFEKIQAYADLCNAGYFKSYLKSPDEQCEVIERYDPILFCYRAAFDKVLNEVENTVVENGTSVIWMLYNMGYIIKTPTACFGVDINHRWALKLEPLLDFMCITHNHSDHYDIELINKMLNANKPVLSNYLRKGESHKYTSTTPTSYTIGSISITTNINDHNSTLKNFVTTFQFNCGEDGGNLVLMHVGDSNYTPSQYIIKEPVDIFIARYAPNALTENNVIGKVVTPKYVFLSHILELAHDGVQNSRWSIAMGLERAAKIDCPNSLLPFWGEKLIWKNGKLNF